jgi:hypothetical protein
MVRCRAYGEAFDLTQTAGVEAISLLLVCHGRALEVL